MQYWRMSQLRDQDNITVFLLYPLHSFWFYCGLKKSPQPRPVCTPYLDFGGNLFCQNRSINPRKPIGSHFHWNRIFQKIAPRLHVWEIFKAKVLHYWSVDGHLIDWKWKETVVRNTQFSLWCPKKSSDRKLVTIFFSPRSRHCLTQQSSHGRPQQHKPTFG